MWNLIVDERPLSGAWNMAVDEFMFEMAAAGQDTYVRFYRWLRPTVSLGYSQVALRVVDKDYCRRNGIDIVRRMTGGKLVLHHHELTYSISSSDTAVFSDTVGFSYRKISESLMAGLKKMNLVPSLASATPDFYSRSNLPCFSHPAVNEVEIDAKKIIGSAQKRIEARFVQHGSIPLVKGGELLKKVAFIKQKEDLIRMTSLSEALGEPVPFSRAWRLLTEGMSEYFGICFQSRKWTQAERRRIAEIRRKYADPAWTFRK